MLLIIEGMAMCLIILLVCVIGIAHDGPAGLVTFYEQDVKDRVIELGLTTPEKIRKSTIISGIAVFIPVLVLTAASELFSFVPLGEEDRLVPVCSGDMLFNVFDEYMGFLR